MKQPWRTSSCQYPLLQFRDNGWGFYSCKGNRASTKGFRSTGQQLSSCGARTALASPPDVTSSATQMNGQCGAHNQSLTWLPKPGSTNTPGHADTCSWGLLQIKHSEYLGTVIASASWHKEPPAFLKSAAPQFSKPRRSQRSSSQVASSSDMLLPPNYLLSIRQIFHLPANPSFLPQLLSGRGWHRFLCCFLAHKAAKTNTLIAEALLENTDWAYALQPGLWSRATGETRDTASEQAIFSNGKRKEQNLSFQEERGTKLLTPKHFLHLENRFTVVVASCDLRLQEGNATAASQLPARAVQQSCSSGPPQRLEPAQSSGGSSAGRPLESCSATVSCLLFTASV